MLGGMMECGHPLSGCRDIAFGQVEDSRMVWDGSGAKGSTGANPRGKSRNKILLSVGGWGADGFSQGSRTAQNREKMAQSAAELVKEYGLDGIDIDWEYPCSSLAGLLRIRG